MRIPWLFIVLAAVAAPSTASAQDTPPNRTPQKGDTIVAVGCLRGSSLESQETRLADGAGEPLQLEVTYRLTGNKDRLKALKASHSKHFLEITGVLKSRLDPKARPAAEIGKTGIYIGIGPPGASRAQPLPVLEVSSFKPLGTECGR